MVKPTCTVKAEVTSDDEWDFGATQTFERNRALKLVSNIKGGVISKPEHKRSARLATKAAAKTRVLLPASPRSPRGMDLEAALIDTEELFTGSFLDPSIDDCWLPSASNTDTILADMDEISAELDLDEIDRMSCSSGASVDTIPDSVSACSLDDVLSEQKPRKKKAATKTVKPRAPAATAVYTVPPQVPNPALAAAIPAPGPMRLSLQKTSIGSATRKPYQYTGVTLSIGGKKSACYNRKPLAVHGGLKIRAHLGFAANLAAVAAQLQAAQ